jgi:regulatory protein
VAIGRSSRSRPRRGRRAPVEQPASAAAARTRALGLLCRRDYPRAALKERLTDAGFEATAAEAALAGLERERLLSDARFAESAVASRIARGHGPLRIALELRRLGLSAELVAAAVDARAAEWQVRAEDVRRRRFGTRVPKDAAARARVARFLLYRGFTGRQVSAALGAAGRDEFADQELSAAGEPGAGDDRGPAP